MNPDPSRPDPTGTDPMGADPAEDVRALLRRRADAVRPTPDWADLQARIDADGRNRPATRHRWWLAVAAVVVVVGAVGVRVAGRDDGADRVTTAGQPDGGTTDPAPPDPTDPDADPSTSATIEPTVPGQTTTTTEPDRTTTTTTLPGGPDAADPIVVGRTTVGFEGIGALRLPATTAEATRRLGQTVAQDPTSVIDPSNPCSFATIEGVPDVLVMLDGDTATRVDVAGTFRTEAGVGVGSTEAEVQAAYRGRVTVEPHPYLFERGNYLRITDPGHPGHELLFETADGVVTSFRSGLAEYVAWIEGCA